MYYDKWPNKTVTPPLIGPCVFLNTVAREPQVSPWGFSWCNLNGGYMEQLNIVYLSLDELEPYEKNARKHQDKDIKTIVESIKQFGMNDPIGIWSDHNVIVEGHGRAMACKQLGIDKVPCIRLDHLTDEQRRAYALAHNKTAEMSEWDLDILPEELGNISEFDMADFGFDMDFNMGEEPSEVKEDDYEVQEPENPIAVLGDVYMLGNHRLMCGDSTSITDVEKLMDGVKADMIHTDPPYGVNMRRSGSIENDDLDDASLKNLIDMAISNAATVSKANIPLYCWIGFRGYALAEDVIKKYFKINNCIVWVKPSIGLGGKGYRYQHELCIFSGNIDDRTASDVWQIARDRSGLHPTMKPLELVGRALSNSSKPNDNILDLFGGSGSTLIACDQLKRKAFLMELDPKYVDVIIDRYIKFKGSDEDVFLIQDGQKIPYTKLKQSRNSQ